MPLNYRYGMEEKCCFMCLCKDLVRVNQGFYRAVKSFGKLNLNLAFSVVALGAYLHFACSVVQNASSEV